MATNKSTPDTKTCTKCGATKPLSAFEKQEGRGYKPGHRRTQCRQCRYLARADKSRAASRAWYWAHRAHSLARNKAWREAHPEQMQALNKDYRDTHQEERRLSFQQWSQEHKEERRAYMQVWEEEHKEERQSYNQTWQEKHLAVLILRRQRYNLTHRAQRTHVERNRRARKKALPDTFTYEQEQFCRQYFHYACAICEREEGFDVVLGLDHWIPISSQICPGNIATNIVLLCHGVRGCNNSKHDKDPSVWLTRKYGKRHAAQILKRINAYFEVVRERFL